MHHLMISILLVLVSNAAVARNSSDDFCEGYEDGYRQGWCNASKQTDGSCLRPMRIPSCPARRGGEKGYEDGFNRGIPDGANDAYRRYGD